MPQVKLISPITRQESAKSELPPIAGYLPIQADQQTPNANQIRIYQPHSEKKKSGSWWRYSLTKGSLA